MRIVTRLCPVTLFLKGFFMQEPERRAKALTGSKIPRQPATGELQ
jgi:hypothetical protein